MLKFEYAQGDFMKKFITLLFFAILLAPVANARLVKVAACSDFSTANPPATWQLTFTEDLVTKTGILVKAGSRVEGRITNVQTPKRLKRDASFIFEPFMFYDTENNAYPIKEKFVGKYSFGAKLKAKEVTKQGVLTAGSIVIPGFGSAVKTVEGVCKNEEGNRVKSGAVALVDSTPISLYKRGEELEFRKGEVFKLSFKLEGEEDTDEE